ncbi:hypothetical protein NITHO_5160020 [Nitrolancea hollandica Lb]|uniref:Uncharacterized protein n=1 Tax=Nitrolancea hollandica Lb TaxID=1129897 RepID=I4ELL4_9BACT|nr:hypothetical protein NITHO_5160020 [Nitrolancea hollandica Lb]
MHGLARAEAQVICLAASYSVLVRSDKIRAPYLKAHASRSSTSAADAGSSRPLTKCPRTSLRV